MGAEQPAASDRSSATTDATASPSESVDAKPSATATTTKPEEVELDLKEVFSYRHPKPGPNLIGNGSFEQGSTPDNLKPWAPVREKFVGMVEVDDQRRSAGKRSLRFTGDSWNSNPLIGINVGPMEEGALYRLAADIRGVEKTTGAAGMKYEFYDEAGKYTHGRVMQYAVPKDKWERIYYDKLAHADVANGKMYVRIFRGHGPIWFDNVSLRRIADPDQVSLVETHLGFEPDTSSVRKVHGKLAKPWTKPESEFKPIFAIRPLDGPMSTSTYSLMVDSRENDAAEFTHVLAESVTLVDETNFEATLKMPPLATGDYALFCKVPGLQKPAVSMVAVTVANRRPPTLSDKGVRLVDGKPFFPIGVYHVRPKHFELLKAHGFNTVQGPSWHNLDKVENWLDKAHEAGLQVFMPLYRDMVVVANLPHSKAKIERFDDHPAVLDWKLMDEPFKGNLMNEVAMGYRELKKLNPTKPINVTEHIPRFHGYTWAFCDIMESNKYVLGRDLDMVSRQLQNARKALHPWQNITSVRYVGGGLPDDKDPTPTQARTMVYLSLINGAKGLHWYAFVDPGTRLDREPIWPHMQRINAETQRLGDMIINSKELGPNGVEVTTSLDALEHNAWRTDAGQVYLLLANPQRKVNASVSLALPEGMSKATVMDGPELEINEAGRVEFSVNAENSVTVIFE